MNTSTDSAGQAMMLRAIHLFIYALIGATLFSLNAFSNPVRAASEMEFRADEVLVIFEPGTPARDIASVHASVGGQVTRTIPRFGLEVVKVAQGTVLEKVEAYRRNPNVKIVQPNYLRPLIIPTEGTFSPSLDVFDEQWSLDNVGQTLQTYTDPNYGTLVWPSIRADADIGIPEAWDITQGSSNVQVAVLDSGVDCNHPDLMEKCADIEHHVSATFNSFGEPIPAYTDVIGHGTHVAGIIGMDTNNGRGGAGIGWNTRIGSFKVCYAETLLDIVVGSNCADSDIVDGVDSVLTHGDYHVINMSFGGGSSPVLQTALNDAFNSGIVLIAAAGNAGNWLPVYPAAYANVVSVGATNPVDDRASFSSFSREDEATSPGDWVDLLAPGDPIISTVPGAFCGADGMDCFQWLRGTSMAAPHASGVAALVWSQVLQSDPTMSSANRDEVIWRLRDCADQIGAMGQDMRIWSRYGRLSAYGAVTCGGLLPPPPDGNHIVALQGASSGSGSTWMATVTITVSDGTGPAENGVLVTGSWNTNDPANCTVNDGQCVVSLSGIRKRTSSVALTVTDPLGADGQPVSIVVTKP
ncbi:MAG: S8 family serine peptidase [Betaproteobacteria bacterium]|nr:MAG: S8 family serine peptidase [Betaproteobacteria bacterium]